MNVLQMYVWVLYFKFCTIHSFKHMLKKSDEKILDYKFYNVT